MSVQARHVERVYDHYARVYDRVFGRVFQSGREAMVGRLNVPQEAHVLEVGVGTGLCLPLYPRHCRITAIDLSAAMIEQAQRRVEREGLDHVSLHTMDAASMAFADDTFDLVVAAYVVTAVPDYRRVMGEIIRVSRRGARIVLLNHFTNDFRPLAAVERAISPVCSRIGFRTDLSVTDVLDGWPLHMRREQRVMPLGMWRCLDCINAKTPA